MTIDEKLDSALLRYESAKAVWDDVHPDDTHEQRRAHRDLEQAEGDLMDYLAELVARLRKTEDELATEKTCRNQAFAMAAAPVIAEAAEEALARFEKTLPEVP